MPESHRHQADWTPERFEQWAADIGPSTLHIVVIQLNKKVSVRPRPSTCLLYTSPSPRDRTRSRMPSSA